MVATDRQNNGRSEGMAPVSRGGPLLYSRFSGAGSRAHVCCWANLGLGLGISVVKSDTGLCV